jgi:hypothetical protein
VVAYIRFIEVEETVMEYFWWGYLGIAALFFVSVLVINVRLLVEYFAIHYDAAVGEFGCNNVLETILYVGIHSLATIITWLVIVAVRSLGWPWILKSAVSDTLRARRMKRNRA